MTTISLKPYDNVRKNCTSAIITRTNKQVIESLSTRISNDLTSMGLLDMSKYFKIASYIKMNH